ncbi:MAG TPA: hypothetical protein VM327_08430 [Candidatus Thermoplasmatota archaeon]|nr:hypothetical protein [Candidatus Thermoplasmatota archaeon]
MFARLHRLLPALAAGLLAVSPAVQAGSSDVPEVRDALKDEATEPGGVFLCNAGMCPPTFATYPGDIEQAWVGREDGSSLQLNLQVNGSAESGGSSSMEWTWTLHWTLEGVESTVAATMTTTGTVSCGGLAASCAVNSTANGASRVLAFTVPKASVGDPPQGAMMTALWAESHGRPQASTAAAAGAADRAPDTGYGADYAMLGPPVAAPPNTTASRSASPSTAGPASDEQSSPGPLPGAIAVGLAVAACLARRQRPGA